MSNKVPRIRFNGYSDAWEQRKLGEESYIKSRIGWQRLTKDEQLVTGDYYLITGTDIDETTHTIDYSRSVYVSKERYEKDANIQVKDGDIIVTKDGTIGKIAMITNLDKPATLNSHLFVLRDLSNKINNRFLLHVLESPEFKKFVEATKTGSTLTGLPQKTFINFKYYYPSLKEQKLIAIFFDNFDNLIT
ncbi:restriction endonuclease subunit S, partial [Leuconostoc suionicum]